MLAHVPSLSAVALVPLNCGTLYSPMVAAAYAASWSTFSGRKREAGMSGAASIWPHRLSEGTG
jgi:hypothetical protein